MYMYVWIYASLCMYIHTYVCNICTYVFDLKRSSGNRFVKEAKHVAHAWCVCMYEYACVYVYIYMYICTRAHVCMSPEEVITKPLYIHTDTCTYIHMLICTGGGAARRWLSCIHAHNALCIHAYVYTYIHTYIHMIICTGGGAARR
jgi:hypothetical protein